jgi:flagellin
MSELHRTSIATTWDQDMKLLDEDVGSVDIQVGTSAAMTINIPIGPLTTRALGLKTNKEDLGTAAAGTSSTSATTTYTMSFGGTAGTFTPGDDYELTVNGVRLTAEDATSIEDVATKLSADYDLKSTGIKSIAVVGTTTQTLVVTWLDSAKDATTSKGPVATLKWSKDTTSINTITGANDAMGYLDKAQQLANAQRSKLGAAMNRIQYTVNNLLNIVQNTQEAKSRIFDTDYAAESAALAKAKVLAEAGTAMLAQANQSQQYVMNLLRGGG